MMDHNLIEKQFDAIFKFSYDRFWICDGKGTVVRCNIAAEHINDIKAAEVVGKHISLLVTGGVVDRTVTEEVLREKRQFTVMQYCPRTKKKLLATGTPILNDSGDIAFVVSNDRDITDLGQLRGARSGVAGSGSPGVRPGQQRGRRADFIGPNQPP